MSSNKLKSVALWVALPYLVGCFLSSFILPEDVVQNWIAPTVSSWTSDRALTDAVAGASASVLSSKCEKRFQSLLGLQKDQNPFQDISIVIHRNGEATSCGNAVSESRFLDELRKNYATLNQDNDECPAILDKYQVESFLTKTLHQMVDTCVSTEKTGKKRDGFLGFCDMGPKKTPILLDHKNLVPVVHGGPRNKTSLPCRFHTREGLRIAQLSQLTHMAQTSPEQECESSATEGGGDQTCSAKEGPPTEIHLYAVPAGRPYMFAPSYVGEIFHLPHVEGSDEKRIYLEVLSLNPRVFDVFNFFSRDESQELVDRAEAEKSESHRIKRSSTGASGYNINSRRTSESGFDTHGKMAVKVKK
jgi:hypothetical protein